MNSVLTVVVVMFGNVNGGGFIDAEIHQTCTGVNILY